jgi:hypothetical protein
MLSDVRDTTELFPQAKRLTERLRLRISSADSQRLASERSTG